MSGFPRRKHYETDEEEKNIQKAIAYYKKSSLQCCVSASLKLSELYAKGIWVQRDLHKSFEILMSMITFPEENFQNGELNKYRVRVAAYALCGYEVDNIYTPRQLLDLVEKDGALYDKDYYYYLQVMEEDEIEPLIDKIQKKFKQYDYYKLAFEFCLEDELHPFTNYDFAENLLKEGFDLYEQDIQENKYFEPIILSLQGLIAIARDDKEDVMGIWEEYSQRKLVPDLYIFNEMCDLFEQIIQPFLEQNHLQPRHKSRNSNKIK